MAFHVRRFDLFLSNSKLAHRSPCPAMPGLPEALLMRENHLYFRCSENYNLQVYKIDKLTLNLDVSVNIAVLTPPVIIEEEDFA